MGAGHCQWGGLTDQNICNIHGGAHLASRVNSLNAIGVHGQTNRKLVNIYRFDNMI